ncbi:polysaccharide lyase family 9 protein [Patellaria atrata CBS 101060]|uniref:Polysaccharide lyase family 9 protein n=1 Tax=Patellaria atrata CBS 101060 TaxID=1346257 RepID=A0A9P4VNA6_9PEZI|nr:polysaccharide lyase family 9 protein [Patellaria atrata CBS 101060]
MLARSVIFCAWLLGCQGADIFVSPTGGSTEIGSLESPFGSIQKAVDTAQPGDIIFLRGGTYVPSVNIQITKKGTSSARFTIRPYESEKAIIDGENMPGTPSAVGESLANTNRGIFHIQNAAYWQFFDLELKNGPYGIYNRDASNNHFERLVTHDNYETGFQLEGASSNNVVLYLDSYRNRDPRKNGESADGFACKEGSGTGNVLRGARLWDNVDDGLDLWQFGSPVTIEDTIAWGNGVNRWGFSPFEGDGNGFKLGGGSADKLVAGNHIVRNCIAFSNLKKGFIDNGNPGALTIERNTAWDNGDQGFVFKSSKSVLKNNIAAVNGGSSQVSIAGAATSSCNSWNIGGTWNNATFKSVDDPVVKGPRDTGGEIQGSNFLLPTSGTAIGATTL